jgi:ribosomal protein S6--L-glutamate ligase
VTLHARIFVMLAFRRVSPPPNPVIAEMLRILLCRGFEVEVGIAEDLLLQPSAIEVPHDLYVLKSHADFWLSIAAAFHQQGALMLNSFPASVGMQNKVAIAERLARAQVPAPRTWLTGDLHRLSHLIDLHPVIVKPNRGLKGREVVLINCPADLDRLPRPESLVLAQEYIESESVLKVYVVDQEVFGIRRPGPLGLDGQPQPWHVTPEVRALALTCGQIFGLEIYGIDVVEGPYGPVVVDVNYFPSFRGVADAPECLADAIANATYGRGGTAAWRNTLIPAVRSI